MLFLKNFGRALKGNGRAGRWDEAARRIFGSPAGSEAEKVGNDVESA